MASGTGDGGVRGEGGQQYGVGCGAVLRANPHAPIHPPPPRCPPVLRVMVTYTFPPVPGVGAASLIHRPAPPQPPPSHPCLGRCCTLNTHAPTPPQVPTRVEGDGDVQYLRVVVALGGGVVREDVGPGVGQRLRDSGAVKDNRAATKAACKCGKGIDQPSNPCFVTVPCTAGSLGKGRRSSTRTRSLF